jgi:hypothetical protein
MNDSAPLWKSQEEFRAFALAGMRKSVFAWFKKARTFPHGSPERRELYAAALHTCELIRQDTQPNYGKEVLAVQVPNQTADLIDRIAAEQGMTPADFMAEAMRLAMWRYGFADGIKVIDSGAINIRRKADRTRDAEAKAKREARDEAAAFPEAQARSLDFALSMLTDTAAAIREHNSTTGAELERLQAAIEAVSDVAASFRAQVAATGWTADKVDYGCEIEQRHTGPGLNLSLYHRHDVVARVVLPVATSARDADALVQQLVQIAIPSISAGSAV